MISLHLRKLLFTLTMATTAGLLTSCDLIPFSSGELSGTLQSIPDSWTNKATAKVIELETNPEDPYSVKLWIIGDNQKLYVHAGANRATWVEHLQQNAKAKVLIDNNLYELVAQRVTKQAEFDQFSALYEVKYGRRPRNEDVREAYLFSLTARD